MCHKNLRRKKSSRKNLAILFAILLIVSFLYFMLAVAGPGARAQEALGGGSNGCHDLGVFLTECSEYRCKMRNPKIPTSSITQEIKGFDDQGRCVHIQKMSDREKITCKYSEDARKYIAIRMEQVKSGEYTNPDQQELEKRLMEDIFIHECNISKIEDQGS